MPAESYANPHCDLSRIHLDPAAAAFWRRVKDTCTDFDRLDAFSPAAEQLRAWGLIFRLELGSCWKLYRTPRGMLWAMQQQRAA